MADNQQTRIPRVPISTPMFTDELGNPVQMLLSRTWIIFFEQLAGLKKGVAGADDDELKATFGLNIELAVENDLTNHFIARTQGKFVNVAVNAKTAPSGQAARLDIQKTTDNGATWATIFADPGYVELEADNTEVQVFRDCFAAGEAGKIRAGDMLRIDCLQAGTTVKGKNIEVVLEWE